MRASAWARKVDGMAISSNMGVPPGSQQHVNNATHTGAAQRQGAAAKGDATGAKEQQQTPPADETNVSQEAAPPPPQGQQPEEEQGINLRSLGKQNGVERFQGVDNPDVQVYRSDSGLQMQREANMMIIGMPDGNVLFRKMDDGKVWGQNQKGGRLAVQADEQNKTLSYQDEQGNTIRVKPENMSIVVNDQVRINADGSQVNLAGQQFVQQPPQQPQGVINPDLGVGGQPQQMSPGQAAMTGAAGRPQERQEQTPSGLMRTITADGLMVIGLPNGVAISHGPAGAMAMDSRTHQPIPVQVAMHRRPDGGEEYRYNFNDAQGNRYTLFSGSMDFSVESADGRTCQLVLPQGNVLSAVRGQDGQWYSHEALPDGTQINRGGAQFAGDRVIMPQGGVNPLPFPVSGYMPPGMQEAAARQAQAQAQQPMQQPQQPGVGPNGFQGQPQQPGVGPNGFQAQPGGGGIPGTPDNPVGGGGPAPMGGPGPAPMGNMGNGEFSPQPSLHPRQGYPQAEVRPGLWQRFKNFFSGRPSNYMPPQQPWSQPNQYGGNYGPQGPWGPPPYAQYGGGMPGMPPMGPTPWGGQCYPPQQSNNWMKWMFGAQLLSSGLTGLMLVSTVAHASPWNIGFFPPMGMGIW